MAVKSKAKNKKAVSKAVLKVPYHSKPINLSMEEWQLALRKQYASNTNFAYKNIGNHLVFSDYKINGSAQKTFYKVSIRSEKGMNFCECMDFKTNNLGTCKHIEHILFKIENNARLKKIYEKNNALSYTSVFLDYKDERKVCIRIGIENNLEFTNLAARYFDQDGIIEENAIDHFDLFLEKAHQISPEFRCYPDALEFVLNKREFHARNQLISKEIENSKFFKSLLKADLFPYQKEGIEFGLRAGRSLIADDMGLGKTIQAIGVAEGLKKLMGISKILIVCPTSLKYQWKTEIEKFTESTLQVIEGNVFQRKQLYSNELQYKICSYNVIGNDLEAINETEFDLVILDEAQRIKNWQTKTAKNVKQINTKYAIVLTGTPIENKLEELYSLVQMVNPYKMGALFRFLDNHQITDETTGKIIGYKDLNEIGELLKDSMIRRHKRDVLKQLPSRIDKNLFVPMTKAQMDYYTEYSDQVNRMVNKWMRMKFLSEKDRQNLLINLNRMRMVCDSTFIIDQVTRHDTKVEELMNILDEVFENSDEKVVVFSQWERMTRIIAGELEARNIQFENLHGGIHSKDREKLFTNFNQNPTSKVFLSTDAGGVGLNLQAASILINMDLPWNPAVLEQRIARIHRMGQKRKVQIINFVSANTIENAMLGKLNFKSAMASGVLDNGESAIFLQESKFNTLMKEVSDLTAADNCFQYTKEETEVKDFETAKESVNQTTSSDENREEVKTTAHTDTFQREIIEEKDTFTVEPQQTTNQVSSKNESADLVEIGTNFFGKLMETLNSQEKTKQLVQILVQTDEKTGETFLKIPVKNQEVIENGLKIFGKLFGN
ncbi:MAG: DEAD/DEAH box helicase [Flavobacteriia bacterium]|nr:DEAD/DEAH box helicase [Flavobacteriia bacterium]